MRYLSVCSGVEAATVAWHPLGWEAVGYSEIEKFPSEVLAHHYPTVTNYGDMTKYKEWNINGTVDLLVGGTPCQSFSVAGLRKGLEDPRGNLALVYCGILDHFKPKWFVWENVPGVLSSNRGRDFGAFLGAVAELGYGFAYRVLDAQYFGVAQRRRRVFVVGCLGDWRNPAKVLFESNCLSRDNPPSREKRESTAHFTPSSFGGYSEGVGTIRNSGGDLGGGSETLVTFDRQSNTQYGESGIGSTVNARDYKMFTDLVGVYENHPSDSRVQDMGDVCTTVTRRWGTGGGNVPFAVQKAYSIREDAQANNFSATQLEVTPALQALRPSVQSHHAQTFIAIQDTSGRDKSQNGKGWNEDVAYTVDTHATQGVAHAFKIRGGCEGGGKGYLGADESAFTISTNQDQNIFHRMGVRRLTPVETERLQGFPDGYTNIPWRGKPESPDAPRYKAMGNSMAVPVMNWIGKRIQMVENT